MCTGPSLFSRVSGCDHINTATLAYRRPGRRTDPTNRYKYSKSTAKRKYFVEKEQELRGLSDETGMFGSITDETIAANAGKTYQDVTALRDPLAGLTGGTERTDDVFTGDILALDYNIHHDPSTGRFTSGSKCGKIKKKTKYTPSHQRNDSPIRVRPKTYAQLTSTLNTCYPGLKEGEVRVIRDAKREYTVKADGYGGMQIIRTKRIK